MSIRLKNVSYQYQNAGKTISALKNITIEIPDSQFTAIIGHTGSGKSTLIQHLNGLLKATSGNIYYNEENIYAKGYSLNQLRNHVGLVFQYPEYQLFEVDVLSDVSFGPKNQGLSKEEIRQRSVEALQQVGMGESYYSKSPFALSGGEKRRVAIAGVLAMRPEILILDEPTAGLDPEGKNELLELLKDLNQKKNMTIILVSHSMEDVAQYAQRVIVMNHGEIFLDGTPTEVFSQSRDLEAIGLTVPQVTNLMQLLQDRGFMVNTEIVTVQQAVSELKKLLQERMHHD